MKTQGNGEAHGETIIQVTSEPSTGGAILKKDQGGWTSDSRSAILFPINRPTRASQLMHYASNVPLFVGKGGPLWPLKVDCRRKKVALFPLRLCYRTTIGACDSGPNRRMRSGENEPCTFSGTWRLLDALRQMAGRARHSWPPRDRGRFVDRNRPETLCRMSFSISSEQWRMVLGLWIIPILHPNS